MLTFRVQPGGETLEIEPRRVLLAGYTGRDRAAVERHIEELKEHGIPAPPRVPTLYPVITGLLTNGREIEVLGDDTSGEAEFVLIVKGGQVYVGVGSDHTDRVLEAHSIIKSKQVCSKVVSPEVWRYDDVKDHWDEIELRSWLTDEGGERVYQDGKVTAMMAPEHLLEFVAERLEDPNREGIVVYSGTLAAIGGLSFGKAFRAELRDPTTGRTLTCQYQLDTMAWYPGE